MKVCWAHCPRLALTPFLCGTLLGILFGCWCYLPSTHNDSLDHLDPHLTCLIILRSKTFRHLNASKLTWLPKCDSFFIVQPNKTKVAFSRFTEPGINSQCEKSDVISVAAESSWGVFCQALHILPRHIQWLIIVPDSVIVLVENLKKFVQGRDWKAHSYLGHPVQHYLSDYNVLSAGLLLSNGTVTQLLSKFKDVETCKRGGRYWNNEDMYLGTYLRELNITVEDTRDEYGRGRFHGFNLNTMLYHGKLFRQSNYFKKALFPINEGIECCSRDLITIDTSDADHALLHYFLIYGIGKKGIEAPAIRYPTESNTPPWVTALREIGYTGSIDNITAQQYYDIWVKHIPPEVLREKLAEVAAP